jgi:exodeoxyribonuclease V gamma subunit
MTPLQWVDALSAAIGTLFTLPDADAWQWRDLDHAVEQFRAAAEGTATVESGTEMMALFAQHLSGSAGRTPYGSGAVTLTSFTGLRGVPHRVVCLLGVDGDFSAAGVKADDLTTHRRRIGEPQPHLEQRAQLLDSVLAAGDRLLITSTGRDPRTNKELAPAVPLAELLALVDATAVASAAEDEVQRVSDLIAVDHPRHAWSMPNFVDGPGAPVPGVAWGFDEAALHAAERRMARDRHDGAPDTMYAPFGPAPEPWAGSDDVSLDELVTAMANPAQAFLEHRLGVSLPRGANETPNGLLPVASTALEVSTLARELLALHANAPDALETALVPWIAQQGRRGALPPLEFGDCAAADVVTRVTGMIDAVRLQIGDAPIEERAYTVDVDGCTVTGVVAIADALDGGRVVIDVQPRRRKVEDRFRAWLGLALVTAASEEGNTPASLRAVSVCVESGTVVARQWQLASGSPADARQLLDWAIHYRDLTMSDFFPAMPSTTEAVWTAAQDGADLDADLPPDAAVGAWGENDDNGDFSSGDRTDTWVAAEGETPDLEEVWAVPTGATELDKGHAEPVRLHWWAVELWDRWAATVVQHDLDAAGKVKVKKEKKAKVTP